jgi:hypothetical protein
MRGQPFWQDRGLRLIWRLAPLFSRVSLSMAKKKSGTKKTVKKLSGRSAKHAPSPLRRRKKQTPSVAKGKHSSSKSPAKATVKPPAKASTIARPSEPPADSTLGRVLGSQDEKLYLLFKEDFHARQIFEFLRAETVKDLEQFSPQEIVKLLSQPIHTTVKRIRQKLAERNRHLAGDEAFVVEYKERTRSS